MCHLGIWADAPRVPRVDDFRHAFAGWRRLRRWYEEGRDVQSELPKLSMYMGHDRLPRLPITSASCRQLLPLRASVSPVSCAELIEGGVA